MPFADIEDLSWQTSDERRGLDAPRCRRPGWIWLGYTAFGIAFWTGMGFGIRALIAAL